ncbi:MAG: tail fiber protein [Solirubrobacteraceae bacterium]
MFAEDVFPGELRLFAGAYVPAGWLGCVGGEVAVNEHRSLAEALGEVFGGGRERFRLPDLRGRGLAGAGDVSGAPSRKVGEYGPALVVRGPDDEPSSLGLTYVISPEREYAEPLIGEVRAFAFPFAPKGWEVCDGRELAIGRHSALYSVIGPRFGRESRMTFVLPDLRSATPVGHGDNPALPPTPIGLRRLNLAPGGAGRRPRLHVNYCIAAEGHYPARR